MLGREISLLSKLSQAYSQAVGPQVYPRSEQKTDSDPKWPRASLLPSWRATLHSPLDMARITCGLFLRSIAPGRFNFPRLASRTFCTGNSPSSQQDAPAEGENESDETLNLKATQILEGLGQNIVGNLRRPKAKDRTKERDRRIPILWDVSVRYMDSEAYNKAYGDAFVWQLYRRNRRYRFDMPDRFNRISCIGDDGFIKYGQACPICRDEYLVLDYRNIKLIKQFIQPATQKVYPSRKTNLCQKKHEELLIAVYKAKEYGTLVYPLQFTQFDYRNFYTPEQLAGLQLPEEVDLIDDAKLHEELGKPEFGEMHEYSFVDFP